MLFRRCYINLWWMMDYRVFLVKWCQICLKLNLNLFKFEPIFPKFLKFRIYRWGPNFFSYRYCTPCTKPFHVQTDASDSGVGAVLLLEGHPLVFVSKFLGHALELYLHTTKSSWLSWSPWGSGIRTFNMLNSSFIRISGAWCTLLSNAYIHPGSLKCILNWPVCSTRW